MRPSILVLGKCLVLIFSLQLNQQKVQAQDRIAYYDAITFSELYQNHTDTGIPLDAETWKILEYYFISQASIQADVVSNPFLKDYFNTGGGASITAGGEINSIDISAASNLAGSIAGLDVTNIAKGISLFMIDRAKQELTAAFFDRLKKYFDKTPEIQVLFPKTSTALTGLLSYHYSEMLPTLRTNFHEDMKLLPVHFDDVLMLPKYKELLADFPEIRITIKTIRLINKIEGKDLHCADIIEKFAAFPEWKEKQDAVGFQNFGNSLKLSAILSKSLRYENDTRAWVTSKQIQTLMENEVAFKIYLGLVYQRMVKKNIKFLKKDGTTLVPADLMVNNATKVFQFQNYVSEFTDLTERLESKIEAINNIRAAGKKVTKEDIYEYVGFTIDIVEYGFGSARLFGDQEIEAEQFIELARNANDLYKNIYQEKYAAAIGNGVSILEGISSLVGQDKTELLNAKIAALKKVGTYDPTELQNKIKAFNGVKISMFKTKLSELKVQLVADLKIINGLNQAEKDQLQIIQRLHTILENRVNLENFDSSIKFIRKYGLFIANMVEAETPKEVQAVIESAVLPVGSSSLKKHSNFDISVQSYLGALYNLNYQDNSSSSWTGQFNITAPIGVSFSYGLNKGGSISTFVSLLDIGAIVDYELKRDTVSMQSMSTSPTDTTTIVTQTVSMNNDYKIELGQIFSPGIFLVYGFPFDTPISLGGGVQYGPGLLEISEGTTEIVKPCWRGVITLTVDIPWFTLYNVEKKRYRKQK